MEDNSGNKKEDVSLGIDDVTPEELRKDETADKVQIESENKEPAHAAKHRHKHHPHHKKFSLNEMHIAYIGGAMALILLINSFLIFNINSAITEPEKLPEIQITIITDSSCDICTGISDAAEQIKRSKAEITKETALDYSFGNVQEFIQKYSIKKIPAIIVTGNLDRYNNAELAKKDGFMIYEKTKAPYIDTETGKIMGAVKLTLINDKDCPQCVDLGSFAEQFRELGIAITDEKTYDVTDSEAYNLVQKYSIEKLPTLIFSSDASVYDEFIRGFPQIGTEEDDGSYVVRVIPPPYITFPDNNIIGMVDVTYLTDISCTECYNVTIHRQILSNPQGFSLTLGNEKTLDVASKDGKELAAKYNITRVPTIILSDDANEYTLLAQTWQRVGTIEKDGTYVFRDLSVMQGRYKLWPSGEIVG